MSVGACPCGELTTNAITFTGLLTATRHICETCLDRMMVEIEERRQQFEELLAAGVDRKTANDIMIARIDQAAPS